MRIQEIHDRQTFTAGRVVFLEKSLGSTADKLEEYLPKQLGEYYEYLLAMMKNRPYDLFISKSNDVNGFYEVNANVNVENILASNLLNKVRPSLVNEKNVERFPEAASEVIRRFESLANYNELIKFKSNIFKMIIGLFKKSN